jgi:hypothetical protein
MIPWHVVHGGSKSIQDIQTTILRYVTASRWVATTIVLMMIPVSSLSALLIFAGALATTLHRSTRPVQPVVLIELTDSVEAIPFVAIALVEPHQDTMRDGRGPHSGLRHFSE